jgi:hypothetical protein
VNKEQTFKESISRNIYEVLKSLGYDKTLEHIGLVEFRNKNNILTFVFEWNQTYAFYCQLQFYREQIDYPLQIVLNRLKGISDSASQGFGGEFDELIDNWTTSLSKEVQDFKISDLTVKSKIIQELKKEFELRTLEYNKTIELDSIKKKADDAWNTQNYVQFITILKDRIRDLPDSYSKKLSIAKKRI